MNGHNIISVTYDSAERVWLMRCSCGTSTFDGSLEAAGKTMDAHMHGVPYTYRKPVPAVLSPKQWVYQLLGWNPEQCGQIDIGWSVDRAAEYVGMYVDYLLVELKRINALPSRFGYTPDMAEEIRVAVDEIRVLLSQQKQDREMICILWNNGTFTQSVGNVLSEDGIIKRALAAAKEGNNAGNV